MSVRDAALRRATKALVELSGFAPDGAGHWAEVVVDATGLVDRVEALVGMVAALQDRPGAVLDDHEECAREVSTLRVALRFYADPANYEPNEELEAPMNWDSGAKAREALDR